ncbi:HAD family hydrolase [Tenuibacillus multivorans]|uniref:HAD-superfamily subfamily IB hydrolase, TIGR01490 n=1 Tax=Tenuibacillus multivorans TaxID=237069 RepID=A0A1H0ATB6_9BACI|nr:HAD-IB family phosphatase [Tenuibacillus multivorans]GEL77827.1 phosphoserine phosphatase [Tenuibacillus multivorans]SDN36732.1 HAD-superfamily subfamily IB hydrolase, TIGR01490 [Tenuibacillus multivorans]
MRVVTVDFDGTLYQGNSFKAMFDVAKKEYSLKQWLTVIGGTFKALARLVKEGKEAAKHTFFHAFVMSMKGKSKDELKTFFDALARSDLGKVNRPLVEKIKQHQANGDQIVILSGALKPFLVAFTEVIDLTDADIIGTELKYDEYNIAAGLMGEIVNGERKAGAVLEWLHSRDLSIEAVTLWAYADSETDSPLLDMVDHPVVVNPNENMEKLAQEKGWPVFGN